MISDLACPFNYIFTHLMLCRAIATHNIKWNTDHSHLYSLRPI